MKTIVFVFFVICSFTHAYDKRLQNANLDFINFEGHNRKPTPQPNLNNPNNDFLNPNPNAATSTTRVPLPNQQRPNLVTGTSSTTKAPVQNPPKPIGTTGTTTNAGGTTNVRQLVQNYNNRGTTETPRPLSSNNRNSPQNNKQTINSPSLPNTGNQGNPQANSGSSWASVAAGRNPAGTVKPLVIPSSPSGAKPQVPGSPSAVNPQGLPGQPGAPKPATPGGSWASVASGNSKPQTPGSPSAVNPQGFPGQPGAPKPATPGGSWASVASGNSKPQTPGSPSAVNPQGLPGQPGAPKPTPVGSWASIAGGKNPSGNNKPQVVPGSPGVGRPQVTPGSPNPTTNMKTTGQPGDAKTTAEPEIASDKELLELSEALLSKDVNNPSKYVTVNIQSKTTSFSKDDVAAEPLFKIDSEVWKIPTIAAMKTLLDNYEQDTTVNEHVTAQEKNEENAFLDLVMATSVMRHLMTFLKDKGIVTPDPKQQRDVLKQTWFNMYSRGQGKIGSSGFEHIFLSEIKNNEVSGLHNWLYFHTEEEAKRANYLGYLKKLDFGNKGNVLKLHFTLKGIDKPVDTMFVGTSPELEMALYSLCFYTRADKSCPISLGGQQFNLRTHNYRYRSKNMIGSAFPEI